jgi:hypothetical protein
MLGISKTQCCGKVPDCRQKGGCGYYGKGDEKRFVWANKRHLWESTKARGSSLRHGVPILHPRWQLFLDCDWQVHALVRVAAISLTVQATRGHVLWYVPATDTERHFHHMTICKPTF